MISFNCALISTCIPTSSLALIYCQQNWQFSKNITGDFILLLIFLKFYTVEMSICFRNFQTSKIELDNGIKYYTPIEENILNSIYRKIHEY